jgi:hypothetical protein
MPNYSLIVNPKFTPMTLDEQIAPLVAYRAMWDNQNKEISNLQKSATEASLLLGPNDIEEKEAYDAYKKDIEAAADRLNKVGYDAESERILRNARNVFARDITPIITASKTREEEVNSQLNTLASNPYAKFAMPASSVSLSTYRKDPTFRANKYFVDATKARSAVETMATEVAKQIYAKDGKFYDALEKIPGMPFKLNVLRHKGFTPQDLLGDNEILDFIVNAAVDPINANIDAWDRIDNATKENTKNWLKDVAKQGLFKSIGDQIINNMTDEYGMQAALENLRHRHNIEMLNRENQQPPSGTPGEFLDTMIDPEDAEYAKGFKEIQDAYRDPKSPTYKLKSQYVRSPLTKKITNPVRVNLEYHLINKGAADVTKAISTGKYNKGNLEKTVEYIINNTNTVQGGKAVKAYLLNSFKKDVPPDIKKKTKFTASDFYNSVGAKVAQRKKDFSIKDEHAKWLIENNGVNFSATYEDINNLLGGGDSPYSRKKSRPYELYSGDKSGEILNEKFMSTLGSLGQKHPDAEKKGWSDFGEINHPKVWEVIDGKLVGKPIDDVKSRLSSNKRMNIVLDPQLLNDNYGYKIGFNSKNGEGIFYINASDLGEEVQKLAQQCSKALKGKIDEEYRKYILSSSASAIERSIKEHTKTTGSTGENEQD